MARPKDAFPFSSSSATPAMLESLRTASESLIGRPPPELVPRWRKQRSLSLRIASIWWLLARYFSPRQNVCAAGGLETSSWKAGAPGAAVPTPYCWAPPAPHPARRSPQPPPARRRQVPGRDSGPRPAPPAQPGSVQPGPAPPARRGARPRPQRGAAAGAAVELCRPLLQGRPEGGMLPARAGRVFHR